MFKQCEPWNSTRINAYLLVPVKKGQHLTTTYTNTLKSTLERRSHLKQTKIFDCDCRRCQDQTEFGTYGSSWVCRQCLGLINCESPLDGNSMWKCEKCKTQHSYEVGSQISRDFQANLVIVKIKFSIFPVWKLFKITRELFTQIESWWSQICPNLTTFFAFFFSFKTFFSCIRKSVRSWVVWSPN